MYLCVRGIGNTSVSTIFRLDFGTGPKVWYFGTGLTVWYFGTGPTVWYFGTVPTVWYFGTGPTVWYFLGFCFVLLLPMKIVDYYNALQIISPYYQRT
jgi:hypothetical protein